MIYRDPQDAAPDAEPAALTELAARLRALRRWSLLPGIVLGIGAGVLGALAHVSGSWPIFRTFSDGSYLVHRGTVAIAIAIPSAAVLAVAWLVYLALRQAVRRSWRAYSASHFRLDDEALDRIEQMVL